ncbi:MAG: hypothetical protein LCH57_12450 [Proteobacteria bacterium]|uniref:hypothetical protein n=1 Tax=Brevundimonas sp. TaxID=1871086 RepID=UPI001AC6AB52|nr:hypothetical protein [Brevundimonas sp.]MBN9466647.1 hypothetical protein [Brevundimonas sp.]MCA0368849.1 hypothetical protein [Pseudomonadota bacterium]
MRSIAIVTAAALLLTPSVSFAQKSAVRNGPDFTLDPNYGSTRLSSGFTPDPFTKSIRAGGSTQASRVRSDCEGAVSSAPDFQLFYEAGSLDLTFSVAASQDTTLLINTPSGRWLCDDDSGGDLDPKITVNSPESGRYDVWVGTYNNSMVQSTLSISELGGSGSSSGSGSPDINLNANYGSTNLRAGFTPDPFTKSILAGGSIPAERAKSGCEGNVSAAPDFQVFYDAGDADLTFTVEADSDTTLLINTPNGRWYCDDDSAGSLNPKVTITNPQNGRYDVWVGTYGSDMVQSTLKVTEID